MSIDFEGDSASREKNEVASMPGDETEKTWKILRALHLSAARREVCLDAAPTALACSFAGFGVRDGAPPKPAAEAEVVAAIVLDKQDARWTLALEPRGPRSSSRTVNVYRESAVSAVS